jgi:hypothetical protein
MRARVLLHRTVSDVLYWMHKKRVQSLKAAVFSALSGRRLSVTGLGRSLRSKTHEKHNIKRADRLLGNAHLTSERLRVYSSLTQQIIGPGKRVVVLVDWADLDSKKRSFLLRAATPFGGRSLTLYEEVHSLRTREKPKTHKQFLKKLQSVLPHDCKPIVVTDAGFRTP